MYNNSRRYLFTSESVTEGHPDKVADKISDAVLDAFLEKDPEAKVACETVVTTGIVFITGEITSDARVDIAKVAREAIKEIGYDNAEKGIDYKSCGVVVAIDPQSPDIAMGVVKKDKKEQGAGDQGLMFGYAVRETEQLMPMPITLAHAVTKRLAEARKKKIIDYLRPDGKAQVTVEYRGGMPHRVEAVVVAAQHDPDVEHDKIKEDVIEKVVKEVIPEELLDEKTRYFVNETGKFVMGGPQADTGLTGRKIIQDTYGGYGAHGGGAFSGKDPSKVDRSGGYAARWVAKNIVAAGLADQCEVQLAYVIGVPEPVSVMVNTLGTNKIPEEEIERRVMRTFDLRPRPIIERLKMLRPIYKKTTNYGHFGREDPDFLWEKTDMVEELKGS
ncbi:MAG: methionine adenosyltransferase [Thermoplasmata archaeon]|nr:methionine adenosyltransferase [Thermoplasmata archaeon]